MDNTNNNIINAEKERERILRKLSFKMPVTLRWGALLGLFAGMIHGGLRQRNLYLITHPSIGMATIGLGLCYHDFYLYALTYK